MTLFKKIIILVLILALPGFLYYLLAGYGKNTYKSLPIFGPKIVAKTTHKVGHKNVPDTIYHQLTDFNLKDQDGRPVSLKTLDKKIFVVNFFYSHCQVCNPINANIDSLAGNFAKNKLVYFVTITVDPMRDTVGALRGYVNRLKPTTPNWLFLTGDTSTIYNFARKGLLVDALQNGKDNFIYSNKLILVDGERRIRGYYSGIFIDDVVRLNDEIKVLLSEEINRNDKPLY